MLRFAAILRDWEGTRSEAADDILYGENESRELKGNELCKGITLTLLTPQFKAYSNGLLTWKLLARRKSESQVVQMYIIVVRYTDGTGTYPQSRGGLCPVEPDLL